ncbi:MAG TPA: 3'(2'),5'-bisphosphate nucleotidase [Cyanobacteria bacterium UBA11149]|nr:3'(2'),5'-bisphosphate nucleotidase [Cyanobacteria bacterium UBA11367]HBE56976.1 3'(2'),5'-bisphosphate nucleotidase [Cyanobacteria bacterium UBA11366]HBK62921.1 3'(2'),5'-bisphosphate nucleotidase [Cyanobacteria bacterium UBA11166]HBR73193.1 3'(2'),5'-bisphosphate nucleotidase [Cyanobacteria bacterium UBA11159]HBW91711.1 3'(2'),5'-bisphosphate nucleotidase [Cyanobacteria bacterium UBA11149]HCA96889.1 3'(2'),5'-bisphosphate nucleotidase [Cyanobacteria bacterium UBA9226]
MLYELEKEIAIKAVTSAAKLCEAVRKEQSTTDGGNQNTVKHFIKPDRTPVTIADLGTQAIICQALAAAFPEDSIVGEEDSRLLQQPESRARLIQITDYVKREIPHATPELVTDWIDRGNGTISSRYWTIDPIDGTKGYIRGGQYAIALALVEGSEVKVGVVGCPALPLTFAQPDSPTGVIFVAVRGQGTTMIPLNGGSPQLIRVNSATSETNFNMLHQRMVESIELTHGNLSLEAQVGKSVGLNTPSLRLDSMAKYCVIARGEAALYIRLPSPLLSPKRQNIWDHAAGAIAVEEAGGKVTDMYGRPLDFSCGSKLLNNQGTIASNGDIHDAVLAAVAEIIASS